MKQRMLRRPKIQFTHFLPRVLKGVKFLVVFVFISLFFSQFIVAGALSTSGGEIAQLTSQLEVLQTENQLLENRLAERSSLAAIRKQAEEQLGMTVAEFEFLAPPQLAELPH